MIIYADIYILENLVINYFILLATSYLLKANVNSFKILLVSILGAFYSLFQFYQPLQLLYSPIGKIIVSAFFVYLTFSPKNFYGFIRQFLSFYLVTIMFGGMGFFLYYISENSIEYSVQLKLKNVLLALGISLIVFKLSYELIIKKVYKDSLIRYIRFKINQLEYSCVGYIDTGNNLKEPFSGKPVVIVEKKLLGMEEEAKDISSKDLEKLQKTFGSRIVLIPYNSIGQEHGVLVGVIPDEFYVSENKNTWVRKDVAIALYDKKISNRYSALLGPDLI
ncbi:stage II sporulation protein GA (sporulation sigma-E factor processing peptidase) [Caldicellulosiruptor bescii]|uniref:Sporulation sigma-E factor-processing peptidase n=3 Tax=Caldicellulosiruptor TaxID=44000 RepID=B9MQA7_CALBD|nr:MULTISPECIES: sigma-E processing peptidase SpoIIGA [Caldicellulosiruptor]ACM59899.1 peptidase U4 sporulation factor SpoIIGA [Caldicellulosiruptor bescii DSM 6725]ADQ46713.1 peptidase U4 sporulation factor SpoIIGA [Caldicellulosiruptor kronotskyensis 2002]PBC87309.1 stage II sporulation protein GA (sporulation sigma-E factor processing peptidase) [Caldicellulosiruptor bescii]PBC90249.1 stage II sporulation protein GA (sporulation sigma-E factor processing peptidase) [Caldicellulosiruptor besc